MKVWINDKLFGYSGEPASKDCYVTIHCNNSLEFPERGSHVKFEGNKLQYTLHSHQKAVWDVSGGLSEIWIRIIAEENLKDKVGEACTKAWYEITDAVRECIDLAKTIIFAVGREDFILEYEIVEDTLLMLYWEGIEDVFVLFDPWSVAFVTGLEDPTWNQIGSHQDKMNKFIETIKHYGDK